MVQQDKKQKFPTIKKARAKRKRRGTCLAFMIIVREKKGIRSYYETPDKMDNFTAPPPSTPTHIPYSFWGVENTMQLVIREAGIDTLIGQII